MEETRRRRGLLTAVVVAVAGGLLLAHPWLPGLPGSPMSLVETFLPWLGLAVPIGLIVAAVRRSLLVALVCLLVGVAWVGAFREPLGSGEDGGAYDLTVVQHNVSDENTSPSRVGRILLGPDPDVIALQELTEESLPAYRLVLDPTHPYRATVGTVGLWSKHPLTGIARVDLKPAAVGPGWDRGLRAVVRSPHGDVTTYVAHLPSVRLRASQGYATEWRDESAARLGRALAADRSPAVLVLGDLNGTVEDRGLAPVLSQVSGNRDAFAFS
ncbi:endonuclease/exonuclease/phosphatase family protein [Streptomyces sp. NPDC047981]|uniref:endonuclease/exonuclease/phosphatase family protein n=1 Tax=Streptomyces sp. NPDC047981 TaxID=3154610 RepID=UPI00344A50AD